MITSTEESPPSAQLQTERSVANPLRGSSSPDGGVRLHFLAALCLEPIALWIEEQRARERRHHRHLWARDKDVGVGVAVGSLCKVAVEGVDNCVEWIGLAPRAVPHPDAGATGIRHNRRPQLFKNRQQTVALCRCEHLFRYGADDQITFERKTQLQRLLRQTRPRRERSS